MASEPKTARSLCRCATPEEKVVARNAGKKQRSRVSGGPCTSSSWSAQVRRSLLQKLAIRLQEGAGHAAQNRLGLLEGLDLLLESGLANVAALVEVSVLRLVLLLHVQRRRQVLLRRDLVALSSGLGLALGGNVTRLLPEREVRVLDEGFVRLLRVRLGLDRVSLEGLRVRDDLLDHGEQAARTRGLLVLLEARRRRRAGRLLVRHLAADLHELLRVDALEDLERGLEEALRLGLVRDGGLEVLVLELAVLACALELELELGHLRLELRNCLRELVDVGRELLDLRLEIRDVARLHGLRHLVLVERLDAEVLHLDVVLLLLLELRLHLVQRLDDLGEGVEADLRRERRQARVAELLRRLDKHLRGLGARVLELDLGLPRDLHEVEGLGEGVVRVVAAEDRERLAAGLDLLLPGLLALLPLLVRLLASLLEVEQELLVRRKRVARVLKVLRLRVLLVRPGLDLRLLRRLEVVVGLLVCHLLLLGGGEVGLESLLHLLENAEDRTRLRRVGLLEGRVRVEVVARGLHEGGG